MAWNLVNIVKIPTVLDVAEAREKATRMRRLSMGMAILTQVHVAKIRFDQTMEEYQLVSQMSDIAKRVHSHTRHAEKLQTKTDLERIQSQAQAVYRHLQKELAYAELQNAAGRLYLSLGVDPLPKTLESHDLDDLSKILEVALQSWGSEFHKIATQFAMNAATFPEMLEYYDYEELNQTLDNMYDLRYSEIHYIWDSDEVESEDVSPTSEQLLMPEPSPVLEQSPILEQSLPAKPSSTSEVSASSDFTEISEFAPIPGISAIPEIAPTLKPSSLPEPSLVPELLPMLREPSIPKQSPILNAS